MLLLGAGREVYDVHQAAFVQAVTAALGTAPVAGYLPHRDDVLTSTDPWSGRIWTADASMAGQITALGLGSQRTFNGTSNNLTTPDTDNLSFGNGTVDSAMTLVALANVTDTAAVRRIIGKYNSAGTLREWLFGVNSSDNLVFLTYDESLDVTPSRTSDGAITQGSWKLFAATYSVATGGATAANDFTLYQDAAAIASTANNAATYVAMENTAAVVAIGSLSEGGQNLTGACAMGLIVPGDRSAQLTALKTAVNTHFALAL